MTLPNAWQPAGLVDDQGRPVSRHVACPIAGGACISYEGGGEKERIAPPDPLTASDRAALRRRREQRGLLDRDFWMSSVGGILDVALLGEVGWAQACYASRSVGAFRLPLEIVVPWRPERQLEVFELLAWRFVDLASGVSVLNLLVSASRLNVAMIDGRDLREQYQVLVAPSGVVEAMEAAELSAAVEQGDDRATLLVYDETRSFHFQTMTPREVLSMLDAWWGPDWKRGYARARVEGQNVVLVEPLPEQDW